MSQRRQPQKLRRQQPDPDPARPLLRPARAPHLGIIQSAGTALRIEYLRVYNSRKHDDLAAAATLANIVHGNAEFELADQQRRSQPQHCSLMQLRYTILACYWLF